MYTVSDFVVDRLIAWGVQRIYGYPGDGIGAFDGALGRADRAEKPLTYIRPTHEELCALMATAHAKFTGTVGVCAATSSPGAFHMINGLYDAKMDNQPVVAIVGQQGLAALGTDNQQESNLERTFADVAAFVQTIVTPMQAQVVIDKAFRVAMTQLQPTVIIIPHDVQSMKMEEPTKEMWVARSSVGAPSTALTPPESEIRKMAEILNSGKKVAMLVGHGANGATDELLAVAEKTGAGVVTALRGKQVVPGDVPYHTQQLGLLGSLPSLNMMQACDTLLMLGSNYPYSQFLPATGQARGIQVDLRPSHLGIRYPMELNVWGDVKSTLQALLPHLVQQEDRSWQQTISDGMKDWDKVLEAVADVTADPINPRKVFIELNKRLPDHAVVTCDAGTTADWYGHHIRLQRGMLGDLSGLLATMVAAMPYAVAAKFAFPERCVVCTIGDGAFQMLGMNELITIKKYMEQWTNKQFIILIMHNDDLTQVSWEMRTEDGNPRWTGSQELQTLDYAAYAQMFGFQGIKVTNPKEIGAALDKAFAHQGVTLLDVYVDKNVPPLPSHITAEFAFHTAAALIKGDPNEVAVVSESAKALVAESVQKVKNALHIGTGDDED
ncbi:MAG: thiamine pyrophosphate-requiring protein [Herpetosiphonaceae bacterium]|nr:thiamine pyrophosphate-requiring protein [Herpetosiphonaceae bacterium]